MKCVLALLLALCLMGSLIPVQAFAVEGISERASDAEVERIEVPGITVLELTQGYWDGNWNEEDEWVADTWYRYCAAPQQIAVYYNDGSGGFDS